MVFSLAIAYARDRLVDILIANCPYTIIDQRAELGFISCFAVCDSSCHIFTIVLADAAVNALKHESLTVAVTPTQWTHLIQLSAYR
jgi:hypothetical protein